MAACWERGRHKHSLLVPGQRSLSMHHFFSPVTVSMKWELYYKEFRTSHITLDLRETYTEVCSKNQVKLLAMKLTFPQIQN